MIEEYTPTSALVSDAPLTARRRCETLLRLVDWNLESLLEVLSSMDDASRLAAELKETIETSKAALQVVASAIALGVD